MYIYICKYIHIQADCLWVCWCACVRERDSRVWLTGSNYSAIREMLLNLNHPTCLTKIPGLTSSWLCSEAMVQCVRHNVWNIWIQRPAKNFVPEEEAIDPFGGGIISCLWVDGCEANELPVWTSTSIRFCCHSSTYWIYVHEYKYVYQRITFSL